ncbi:hypothetical protein ASD15_05215 [Massilia sp. Root351]|jgi:hypothetical protein|uniref:hypothetical protein n=1 Tax=Massilia sp. Root351 TaxID=1736522 RepID=UPI00070D55BD|nr:hypothetical protein [Massilia sp. Root351]KQV84589.1 hypothetical protein ASD15_05215 [Massilia sp. Root351]
MSNKRKPGDVVLTVIFDIDQDSQLLQWSFTIDGEPISGKGVETGLLAFVTGDTLKLVAIAKSKNGKLNRVTIDDCFIITTPRVITRREDMENAGQFAPPSPFARQNAVVNFGTGAFEGSNEEAVWVPPVQFDCSNLGRWELSFIMTTTIHRTGDMLGHEERRVFGFDPECEVGPGG